MCLVILLFSAKLSALAALEWLLALVGAHVCREIAIQREALAALTALEGLLPRVGAHM